MGTNRRAVEEEVERTMRSLDDLESIRCAPDFSFRLQARIRRAEGERAGVWRAFRARRVLVPAMLFLLILLNALTALTLLTSGRSGGSGQASRQQALTEFAATYSLTQNQMDIGLARE